MNFEPRLCQLPLRYGNYDSSFFVFQSPTPLSSKNGLAALDGKKEQEEQSNLLPRPQEHDSLQADSERGLVKLSSV